MSVTSMSSRMAMAEKLSIPQLQQAIKAGTIPAYMGIPLLQQKIKEQKQAQMPQQAPASRPVASAVMDEAEGIASIPSNLPVSSMGRAEGIASFAEGGEVDDDFDYEDYLEQEEMDEYQNVVNQYLMAAAEPVNAQPRSYAVNRTPSVEGGLRSLPEAQTAPATSVAPTAPAALPSVGRGPVSEAILKGAEAHNMPVDFLARLSGPESSGNPNAKNPLSSAKGLYQFTDATWKAMGGEPGKQFDPYENAEKAAKLTKQNVDALANTLGRTPTYAEAGMAHRFGSGVGKMLKTADMDTPIEKGLRAFERPDRVALIMKQNPDLRGKTVGDVLNFYERKLGTETFADGGVVRYENGGRTRDIYGPVESPDMIGNSPYVSADTAGGAALLTRRQRGNLTAPPIRRDIDWVPEQDLSLLYPERAVPAAEEVPSPYSAYSDYGINEQEGTGYGQIYSPSEAPSQEDRGIKTLTPGGAEKGAEGSGTITRTEDTKPRSAFESFMDEVRANREELKKQKEQDKYLSILAAGLGMMSGSSPNALSNIGQGAQAGIATYASLAKQRAAENAALNKSMLTAQRYQSMEDIAARTADINEKRYADMISEGKLTKDEANRIRKEERLDKYEGNLATRLKNTNMAVEEQLTAEFGKDAALLNPKGYQERRQQLYSQQVRPLLKLQEDFMKKRYPDLYPQSSSQSTGNRPPLSSFTR